MLRMLQLLALVQHRVVGAPWQPCALATESVSVSASEKIMGRPASELAACNTLGFYVRDRYLNNMRRAPALAAAPLDLFVYDRRRRPSASGSACCGG